MDEAATGSTRAEGARPDPKTPSVARMYDFFLGGTENFAVDRHAAEEVVRALPDVAGVARSNRQFPRRAVRFAAERGVDQFLDLGACLPTSREQVTALLDGLEIVPPGVVRLHEWRLDGGEYATDAGWTAVAGKDR